MCNFVRICSIRTPTAWYWKLLLFKSYIFGGCKKKVHFRITSTIKQFRFGSRKQTPWLQIYLETTFSKHLLRGLFWKHLSVINEAFTIVSWERPQFLRWNGKYFDKKCSFLKARIKIKLKGLKIYWKNLLNTEKKYAKKYFKNKDFDSLVFK